MENTDRRMISRKAALLTGLVLFAAIVVLVLRGPSISNALKQNILPELELMLGRKVIAQSMYLNVFPLFIEAKGIKVFDDRGERLLRSPRVKAYIDVSGLLSKRITIRRLVVREPELKLDRAQAEDISAHITQYLASVRENALKVKVLAVELQSASAELQDEKNDTSVSLSKFSGEAVLGKAARVFGSAEKVALKKKGIPELSAGVSAALLVKDGSIEIRKLTVDSFGSRFAATGEYAEGQGRLKTGLTLLVSTVKKFFGLQRSGEGSLSAEGTVDITREGASVDLDLQGSLYIQSLMELLEVEERVEGYLTVKGHLKGPLSRLSAEGSGELKDGNLFDVDVDKLSCRISYADGVMKFIGGTGRLYNGTADVSASITLPVVNRYTLSIAFKNVDSRPVFKLIGWDPGIMPGKVTGRLENAGEFFNPSGSFTYRASEQGSDVLGRIRDVSGDFVMRDDLITLSSLKGSTGASQAEFNGTVDLKKEQLALRGQLKTNDVSDLAAPYYSAVHGAGDFTGSVGGTFADPVIEGKVSVINPVVDSYSAERLEAGLTYSKNLLALASLKASGASGNIAMTGSLYFREARELFDLKKPIYDINVSVSDADFMKFGSMLYQDFRGSGRLRTDFRIAGREDRPELSGEGSVSRGSVYDLPFDSAAFGWKYHAAGFDLLLSELRRGRSTVSGRLNINPEGRFVFSASSDRMLLTDLVGRQLRGDAVFSLKAEGAGTPDLHDIKISAEILEGRLREKPVGSGRLSAQIKDRNLSFSAALLNDKVRVFGKGRTEKELPWEAKVEIRQGRYDQVISAFLKDIPDDLILSLNGDIKLHGDRKSITASALITQVNLAMYGYSFVNDNDIRLELKDRHLVLDHISMKSGNSTVRINGNLDIGRSYNLTVEGGSALSPFKSLSSKIGVLKGDAEFNLDISGEWEKPVINGGVSLTNGAFSLKEFPYRISSLSGYLYLDNDRIVLEKLSGKVGGGEIDLTGLLYLKRFSVNRFFIEMAVNNISASVSADFPVNFSGNLVYKGTLENQLISGDIKVNRARYRERVEWKSWLLRTRKSEKIRSDISGIEKAELNVRVIGKENIQIDNNIARADVSGDLLVRGTLFRPIIFGRIESKEGNVFFRNNDFRILHSSADFADQHRINPVISIAAETIVKGYKIKMNLEGHMHQFTMSLTSDPVLKEMDILSLLTVGQTGGQLKGLEGGVGAGEATSFVTGKLQDVVEERLRNITGLDRFQVDPRVSRATGNVEPRVTVSKRLLGEKMFVTYTSALGASEEQIIKLEYFLNRNISLVGIRDERGIVGADVKFRFEFK